MGEVMGVCLSGTRTSIWIPSEVKFSDAFKFYNYKKNQILQDCIEHPERYLEDGR